MFTAFANLALLTLGDITGLDVDSDVDVGQLRLEVSLQMVAYLMCFFNTYILRQHKVKVDKTLVARFTGTHLMETGNLAGVLHNGGGNNVLFRLG